jgi:hypothetical protein
MKTIIASILLVGFVIVESGAQTTAGSFLIGGSAGVQRNKQHLENLPPGTVVNTSPITTSTITPSVGYFVINNFMVGLQGNYSNWRQSQGGIKSRTNSFSIGPVLRYYIPFGGKFALFPEASAAYSWSLSRSKGDASGVFLDYKNKSINYIYKAGAGVTWFVKPNIGIEAVLGYRQNNKKSTPSYTTTLYTSLAIQFYLSRAN